MTDKKQQINAAQRLEVVMAYLYGNISYEEFTDLFNAEKVYKTLHKKTGDITAKNLERWASGCYKAVTDE
jgi:hypothetical protein